MDITGRIEAVRKALHLNNIAMAKALGLSRSHYYNVKNGENDIGSAISELERLEDQVVLKARGETRIKEAADYANQYATERERQIAFEGKLNEKMVDEYRDRAIAAEEKLAMLKEGLQKLLDEM